MASQHLSGLADASEPQDVYAQHRPSRCNTDLSDAEWLAIQPLLPPQKPRIGRPAQDHRTVVNAILWVTRTGYPWRSLPARYGKWTTASSRYHRWLQAGIWANVTAVLARKAGTYPNGDRARSQLERSVSDVAQESTHHAGVYDLIPSLQAGERQNHV